MRGSNFAVLMGVAVIASGVAAADMTIPHQKLGLWQSIGTAAGGQDMSTQSCIDAASEAKMSAFSSQSRNKMCKSSQITHNMDGSWTSVSTCQFMPGKVTTTRGHVTGDLNSKFTIVVHTDGSKMPDMTMTMTWMGPCKPGMKGGDVFMPNGVKMNVIDGTMSGLPKH
ncbi:MAG: DUF3617 family protein [Rhizomicrobium sp.]|jgi:hypothetical protein